TPTRRTAPTCCACAASGHATADPAIPLMKSRRRIASLMARDHASCIDDYSRDLRPAKRGLTINLRCKNPEPPMSALGQKQTSQYFQPMSALPPKADIAECRRH